MQMLPEFVTEFCVDRHQKIKKYEVQCKICQMQARMPQVSNKLLFQMPIFILWNISKVKFFESSKI